MCMSIHIEIPFSTNSVIENKEKIKIVSYDSKNNSYHDVNCIGTGLIVIRHGSFNKHGILNISEVREIELSNENISIRGTKDLILNAHLI